MNLKANFNYFRYVIYSQGAFLPQNRLGSSDEFETENINGTND